MQFAKYKIGIFGSNTGDMHTTLPQADELGRVLGGYAGHDSHDDHRDHADHDSRGDQISLIIGAFAGIPYQVCRVAAAAGTKVWGFSEAATEARQRELYPGNDLSMYDRISYLSADFQFADYARACKKYRNVLACASCDAGIIIAGRWGSLNEFTNLLDMQKTVGVLTGTGGTADQLPALARAIAKPGQGQIIFDADPAKLVAKILAQLSNGD